MKLLIEFDIAGGVGMQRDKAVVSEIKMVMDVIYEAIQQGVREGTLLDESHTPFGTWDIITDPSPFASTLQVGNVLKSVDTVDVPVLESQRWDGVH